MSNEIFTCAYIANVSLFPKLIWINNSKTRLKFKGSCLKQEDKAAWIPERFTRFKHWFWSVASLFGAVKLTKNADKDKYKYSGYGIGFDSRSEFYMVIR